MQTSLKTGILLTNLGTPDAPTRVALKRYLAEFLSDPRVVDPPNKWLWWLALHGVILNIRPQKSAKNYAKIWGKFGTGSPLLDISYLQFEKIKTQLSAQHNTLEFALAMRYGKPSIAAALSDLRAKNCNKIIVLPLYPQYSKTTTLSTFDAVQKTTNTWSDAPELVFIEHYYQNSAYIQALANSVLTHQKRHGTPDKLLISFHGIPQRYVDNGDIYYQHCVETAQLLVAKLGLTQADYCLTFQSIFGREKWLEPYTKNTLEELAQSDARHVQVICPGFSADCLETLEEIEVENRGYFMAAGGDKFSYIPALNDQSDHIEMLCGLVTDKL